MGVAVNVFWNVSLVGSFSSMEGAELVTFGRTR